MTLQPTILFTLLFTAGLVIGAIDSISGGGSLLMVALLSLANLSPLAAIVTMRLTTLLEESVAAINFARKKTIDWSQALLLGLASFFGSLIGASLLTQTNIKTISLIMAGAMLLLLPLIPQVKKEQLFFPIKWFNQLYQKIFRPEPELTNSKLKLVLLTFFCFGLGIYGGFLGAGFQTILLIVFSLTTQANLLTAAGNAKLISFIMSLAASSVFLQSHLVNWPILIPLATGSMIGAWKGVNLIQKIDSKYLRWILYLVVIASAVKLLLAV